MNNNTTLLFMMNEFLFQRVTLILLTAFVLFLLIFAFTTHIQITDHTVTSISILNGTPITGPETQTIVQIFINTLTSLGLTSVLILCVIASANLLPDMFANGKMIFFLTKPFSRMVVLTQMFVGVVSAFFIIQCFLFGSFWLILSLKIGFVSLSFLTIIIPMGISFAAVYALMMLLSLTVKSTGLVTFIGFIHVGAFSSLLSNRFHAISNTSDNGILHTVIVTLYYILPQIEDLRVIAKNIAIGEPYTFFPILLACVSATIMLLLSFYVFRKMDI